MLIKPITLRARQQGVTLMIALIVLVAITLAGIALVRSVDTSNVIAGNLAFQQAAMHSSDIGTEAAVTWLETKNSGAYLFTDHNSLLDCNAYTANRVDPTAGQSWESWWNALGTCQKKTVTTDAAGNTIHYTIDRMCELSGDPNQQTPSPRCSGSTISNVGGATSSQTSGYVVLNYSGQIYYRITSRIDGPRGTKSYVQAVVAM